MLFDEEYTGTLSASCLFDLGRMIFDEKHKLGFNLLIIVLII
jgi:hypothetical protein